MQKLSQIVVLIVLSLTGYTQTSPHGTALKIDCISCHTSKTWKMTNTAPSFDHNSTTFKLTGQHQATDCILCHKTLKFEEAKGECISCHTDMHQNTLGMDCARCHSTKSWIIENTKTMHQMSRFPLLGNHAVTDCASCHISSSNLKYPPLGIECVDCHRVDYQATKTPNHQQAGYSTACSECHGVKAISWTASDFEHGFFPLNGGHNISCNECHKDGSFQKISNECISCHQNEYNSAINPNHQQSGLSTSCVECHTINPGWSPASYKQHDSRYFPIYSGSHKGEWNSCTECHTNNNYTAFNCTNCHEHSQSEMNGEHDDVNGYSYQSTACYSCHPQGDKSGSFNHSNTNFELKGAHITADCLDCHTTGYSGTSMECNSCHQKNFTDAQTPSHTAAGISVDCKTCHSSSAWQPSSFNHITTGYELTGGHAAVVQCSDCHLGNTSSAKTDCISCHQVQYNEAKGHVDSKFPIDCTLCHNSANWLGAKFDHNATNFALTGSHTTVECASCHTSGVYTGLSSECKACHQAKFNSAKVPSHTAAGISDDCKTCHTATGWQPSTFNHTITGFALSGGHAAVVQCSSCHKGNTTSATSDCISCHKVQYDGAKGHLASSFPTDCKMCHNSNNWLNASFDHSLSGFPLSGVHATVVCASCHTSGVYTGLSSECKACHQDKFNSAQVPSHTAAGISDDCKTCHTAIGWQPSTFNHTTTGFALSGGHAAVVQCSSCHKGNTSSATSDCISCHKVQYDGAKGHLASSFPTDCKMCHNSNNWLNASFDHSQSGFPLTGAHATVVCASCHTSGVYTGLSSECKSCHQAKFNTAQVPSHTAAGISDDCKTCHTATGWQPSTFNHTTTGFALSGGHAAVVQCSSCHKGNTSSATSDCISCHKVQYDGAKGHLASSFPTDCKICHNSNNWLGATFDHSATNFPLTGAHVSVDCAGCHTTGYVGTSMECKSCHQAKFNAAQVPSHNAAGISDDCKTCHTATGWQPSTFNHTTTGFALSGGHAAVVQCSSCHKGNTTSATSDCISCHKVQYDGAPGHLSGKFPTDCKLCHSSNNWLGASFNHSQTAFPLTGAHTTADCASCHNSGVYDGLSMECKSCHQTNYNAAVDPNHKTLALPVTCADCHTTNPDWKPASFAIHNNYYALTGAHSAIAKDCAACHKGTYTNTPNTCNGCHAADYNTATNPNHKTAQFPTDCATCHTSNAWAPSTFNHDAQYFPIYSGKHKGKWVLCSECHTSTTNFALFSCIKCHEHSNKTSVDNDHRGENGYTYTATSCYTCHPRGNSD